MKSLFAALLLAVVPIMVLAQAKPADPKPAATAPAPKPATAGAPKAAKPPVKAKSGSTAKPPPLARSALKAVEEVTPIDEDLSLTLTPAELEIAKTVYVGEMKCELGASVLVRPARREGFFMVITKGARFMMHPVESRTGAIRLEDPRRGAMWLQLGNKSMLMSQKLGQRLADECQSPQQLTVADDLKRNPRPSILEPMPHHGQGGMHGGMHGGGGGMQGGMHGGGMGGGMPGGTPPAAIPVPGASAPAAAAAAQHSASQPHAHPAPADAAPVPAPAVPGSGSPPAR